MISEKSVVCFGSSWFIDPTSKHQVMKRLSRSNDVLWINYHASRRPQLKRGDLRTIVEKLRQVSRGAVQVSDSLRVLTPLVIPLPGRKLAELGNRALLRRAIRRELRRRSGRPVQLWTFAPDVSFMAGSFGEELLVYYCVDEFSEFAGYDREEVRAREADLLSKADLVITTSQALQDSKSRLHRNTHLVPHGVDYDHFRRALEPGLEPPPELRDVPRPILGFFGLIEDWVDLELVARVAKEEPEWSVVLLGHVARDASPVASLPNVRLLGRQPYERLPAFAKAFDVGLIPFRINELTRHVNPIKLREYLSAGLPVVSTPLPEVAHYRDFCEIADAEGFVAACGRALDDGSTERRRERSDAMASESWDAKVEHLSALAEETLARKVAGAVGRC